MGSIANASSKIICPIKYDPTDVDQVIAHTELVQDTGITQIRRDKRRNTLLYRVNKSGTVPPVPFDPDGICVEKEDEGLPQIKKEYTSMVEAITETIKKPKKKTGPVREKAHICFGVDTSGSMSDDYAFITSQFQEIDLETNKRFPKGRTFSLYEIGQNNSGVAELPSIFERADITEAQNYFQNFSDHSTDTEPVFDAAMKCIDLLKNSPDDEERIAFILTDEPPLTNILSSTPSFDAIAISALENNVSVRYIDATSSPIIMTTPLDYASEKIQILGTRDLSNDLFKQLLSTVDVNFLKSEEGQAFLDLSEEMIKKIQSQLDTQTIKSIKWSMTTKYPEEFIDIALIKAKKYNIDKKSLNSILKMMSRFDEKRVNLILSIVGPEKSISFDEAESFVKMLKNRTVESFHNELSKKNHPKISSYIYAIKKVDPRVMNDLVKKRHLPFSQVLSVALRIPYRSLLDQLNNQEKGISSFVLSLMESSMGVSLDQAIEVAKTLNESEKRVLMEQRGAFSQTPKVFDFIVHLSKEKRSKIINEMQDPKTHALLKTLQNLQLQHVKYVAALVSNDSRRDLKESIRLFDGMTAGVDPLLMREVYYNRLKKAARGRAEDKEIRFLVEEFESRSTPIEALIKILYRAPSMRFGKAKRLAKKLNSTDAIKRFDLIYLTGKNSGISVPKAVKLAQKFKLNVEADAFSLGLIYDEKPKIRKLKRQVSKIWKQETLDMARTFYLSAEGRLTLVECLEAAEQLKGPNAVAFARLAEYAQDKIDLKTAIKTSIPVDTYKRLNQFEKILYVFRGRIDIMSIPKIMEELRYESEIFALEAILQYDKYIDRNEVIQTAKNTTKDNLKCAMKLFSATREELKFVDILNFINNHGHVPDEKIDKISELTDRKTNDKNGSLNDLKSEIQKSTRKMNPSDAVRTILGESFRSQQETGPRS